MKILVTGGAGRLGRAICGVISSSEHTAKAFDLPEAPWDALDNLKRVEMSEGDITDPASVEAACEDIDVAIHLAALLPPNSERSRELTFRVNCGGTSNLLKALEGEGGASIVFASSVATYRITAFNQPSINEDHPQSVHDLYSESKIEAERLIRASGIPHVILRVAPIAVADLLELPEVVPYKADQRVEFIHVTDAALAFYKASVTPKALGRTLNIAGGPSWQMTGAEYIEAFYGALGVEVEPNFPERYTAVDWYDTSRSRFVGYQRTTFNDFLARLKTVAQELGIT